MAREYGGDIYDLENMSDDEIRTLVLEQLREYPNLDPGWIDVDVRDGFVTLSGQVGTDGEYQVAEQVIHDVIGIQEYANELTVTEIHRGEAPEAADDAAAENDEVDSQLGESASQQSDTADHLSENLEDQAYGTHDPGEAIRGGATYVPPDRPVPDGYDSRENH